MRELTLPQGLRAAWGRTVRLAFGKVRRFWLHTFRPGYVRAQAEKREGSCGRCAACCKLLFQCPFLDESGAVPTCSIHESRPDNCRFFPVDPRDLADRDLVDPLNPCGFSFPEIDRPAGTRSESRAGVSRAMGD